MLHAAVYPTPYAIERACRPHVADLAAERTRGAAELIEAMQAYLQ
jgi:hypothetical protein